MANFLRSSSKLLLTSSSSVFNFKHGMSIYAPYYIEPIFKKDKIEELVESGEFKRLGNVPVKPPRNDQSCSSLKDETVRKFTNIIMKTGQKHLARQLLEETFHIIKRKQIELYHLTENPEEKTKIELDPRIILHKAVDNCKPVVQLQPVRRGGVKYQVPIAITDKRSTFESMRWLIHAGRDKERKTHFPPQLARELIDAAHNRGRIVKKKQDLHRQCEANRAYAHYRWA